MSASGLFACVGRETAASDRAWLLSSPTDPYLMENCLFDYFVQNAETEGPGEPYKVIDN